MARRKTRTLTELELEIMQVVWKQEEVTVRELRDAFEKAGKPLASPSIRTMLSILRKKGYVTRRRLGRGYAYQAAVSAGQARKRILKDMIERAFEGSATSLVAALLNARMVRRSDLEEVRRLIEQQEKGERK
jgi:predicted transcriptional regulator